MNKNKLSIFGIILTTIILAGVAIFTAIRLYNANNISPTDSGADGCNLTAPTGLNVTNITATTATLNWTPGTGASYVKMWVGIGSNPTLSCNGLPSRTTNAICVVNENTDYGLSALPSFYSVSNLTPSTTYYWRIMTWKESGCDQSASIISFKTLGTDAPNTCQLSFTLVPGTATATATSTATATATATATSTATVTATATATVTSTPVPQCNNSCTNNSQCPSGLMCYIASGATAGNCRNTQCLSETDCLCATATATATSTSVAQVTSPTEQPELPVVGTSWPTILGTMVGILVIIGSLLLAL